jgi:inner membrane protein
LENFTHSLVGAVVADAMLGAGATKPERRLFLAAGVIASNAPDLDLLYTSITPMPIGYLLHHRGHTHTLAGLLVQFVILALVTRAVWSGGAREPAGLARLWIVVAVSLLLHLGLDAANTYGVHPFFPMDNRWYYGDAFFIFEPWLWVVLGTAAAVNATTVVGRALLLAFLVVLPGSTAVAGLVPWASLVILGALALVLARVFRHRPPRTRAGAALVLCAMFAGGMMLVSRQARSAALAGIAPSGHVLDIVLTPSPALPVCWAVIVIERDDQAATLVLRRGSLSLAPGWRAAASCPLNRFATSRRLAGGGTARVAFLDEYRLPIEDLRALAADCRASAWLRFARAPVLAGHRLFDLRFENAARGNFTSMTPDAGDRRAGCPPFVPHWEMPRTDALTR